MTRYDICWWPMFSYGASDNRWHAQ